MTIVNRLGLKRTVITLGVVLALAVISLSPTVLAQSQSSDATLSALTLSDVGLRHIRIQHDFLFGRRCQPGDGDNGHSHREPLRGELRRQARRH